MSPDTRGGAEAEALQSLSPVKRALLEKRLAERRGVPAAGIPRRAPGATAPLTHTQRMLWLFDRVSPAAAAYNMPEVLRLHGQLDSAALQAALDLLVSRHEVLRTVVGGSEGEPVQVVREPAPVPVPHDDLRSLAGEERTLRSAALVRETVTGQFDLTGDLLLRVRLIRVAEEEHILVLVTHHIASDGWSRGIVFRELAAGYNARHRGEAPALPPLPVQFADYALWLEEQLAPDRVQAAIGYWRDVLSGELPGLHLPTDRPRTGQLEGHGAVLRRLFSPDLLNRVRAFARAQGATPFMVLMAAWQTLLARHAGQEEIIVGTPVAGRENPEVAGLVGLFLNTLPIRISFADGPTFAELVGQVRTAVLGAFEHQDVPLEMILQALPGAGEPLFRTLFSLRSEANAPLALDGLRVMPEPPTEVSARLELTLTAVEREDGLFTALEYSTELFDRKTVEGLLGRFGVLLEASLTAPTAPVATLPMLDEAERRLLLVERNANALPFDSTATLDSLVAAQVRRTPQAVAVAHGSRTMTYGELDAAVGRLALRLTATGVTRESLVAICAARTPALIVGLLAIQRAGGAYVPLDPAYPESRSEIIISDSQARVVLTESVLAAELPFLRAMARADGGVRVVLLDEADATELPGALPLEPPRSTDLAYVIYTSGSTGRPKGVAIEHRSAVALLAWADTVYGAEELRGVLASTSICFDLSVFEIFLPLSRGGTVVLAENALQLPSLAPAVPVTLINTVPSVIAELLRLDALPSSAHTVNLAGEPLSQRLVEDLYALPQVERVYDLYGPSEDTTYSTWVCRRAGGRATIGRPIANTQAYVLDGAGQLTPPGVPGELYLGGDGLARGYLGRDDLTRERFVTNPLAEEAGRPAEDRLYRTGDKVRWTHDGELEYLGRLDYQVKLRGFRIELGEIESVLCADPGVDRAVAQVRRAGTAGDRLVAYVTSRNGTPPEAAALLSLLRSRLPSYMVPASIMVLDQLPLTPNGKIDRGALPAPDEAPEGAEAIAPRDDVERVIAGVWGEVLGRPVTDVDSSFFDLGGHSLLAVRTVGKLGRVFRSDLSLRRFFDAPTIAGVARTITADEAKPGQAAKIAALLLKLQSMTPDERDALHRNGPAR